MHFLLDFLPLIKDVSAIICYFVLRDGHPFSFILCFTPCIRKPVTQFYLDPLTIKKIDPWNPPTHLYLHALGIY